MGTSGKIWVNSLVVMNSDQWKNLSEFTSYNERWSSERGPVNCTHNL
jgi:hypothetical protein